MALSLLAVSIARTVMMLCHRSWARAAKARAAREAAARAAAGGEGVEMTQNPLARRASRTRRARARRTPRAATDRAHRMGACVCVFYRYILCESCIGESFSILLTSHCAQ